MPASPRIPPEGLGGFGRPGQIMAFTSTVAGLALGFATETGADYLNDTFGTLASDLASSGYELASQKSHSTPKIARPDSHFLARMPLAAPAQDLALAGIGATWQVGAGDFVQMGSGKYTDKSLGEKINRHVYDWSRSSPLRFYGEPLALLALLGVGGVGSVALSAASLLALVRRLPRNQKMPSAAPPVLFSIQELLAQMALAPCPEAEKVPLLWVPENSTYISVIPDKTLRDMPERDPIERQIHEVVMPQTTVRGRVSYGGTGSKYSSISEDGFGFGLRPDGSIVAYVFDGAGMGNGFEAMQTGIGVISDVVFGKNASLIGAIDSANNEINNRYPGGGTYGTVAGVDISPSHFVTAVGVGDARVVTIRGGAVFDGGSTKMHNRAQSMVESGVLKPEEYYTSEVNNWILKTVGSEDSPFDPEDISKGFQGEVGDLLVIGSDGLFDIVTPYEIAELSKVYTTAESLQTALFALAYARNQTVHPYTIYFDATTPIEMDPRGVPYAYPREIDALVSDDEIEVAILASQTADEVRTKIMALAKSHSGAAITDAQWEKISRGIKGRGDNISVMVVGITAAPKSR